MLNQRLIFIFGAMLTLALALPGLALAQECHLDQDCGDADPCTEDWCDAGACMHEVIFDCEEEEVEIVEDVEIIEEPEIIEEGKNACELDEDCKEGEKCFQNECVEKHVECYIDDDCLEGEVCILGYCLFEEEEEEDDSCVFDEDCEHGQICEERHCIDVEEPVPTLYEESEESETDTAPTTTSTTSITNQEALFGFIPMNQTIELKVNDSTGEVINTERPWWDFLTTNVSASEAIDIIVNDATEILNQALNSSTTCEDSTSEQVKSYTQTMERVRYFQGQLLAENDLQSQLAWTQQKLQLRTLRGISQNCPNMWQAEVGQAQTTTTDLIPNKYKKMEIKRAKLFWIFGIDMQVEIEVNAETEEELIKHKPWWSWMAKIVNG